MSERILMVMAGISGVALAVWGMLELNPVSRSLLVIVIFSGAWIAGFTTGRNSKS